MIQFQKTNEKGDRLKAYTHKGYLSSHYGAEICQTEKRSQTIAGLIGYGSTIASYWALNNTPKLSALVQSKLPWKGGFLVASAVIGLVNSFVASFVLAGVIRSRHESLLKKEVFPAWLNKQKVINPDRVFFELDDTKNNEPTILHTAITQSAIEKLIPDFIMGNPHKPHIPVAEEHHH